jgi:membrane protein YqaA with SNARE-associated domain
MAMSETSPKADMSETDADANPGALYLVIEVLVIVVVGGVVFWLMGNYQPRTFAGEALLNLRLWILVLVVSAIGTTGCLAFYYLGQRGTKAVFDRYPQLEGKIWQRVEGTFQRFGSLTLAISGIPILGTALLIAAGAFGIGKRAFLVWAFVGRVLRYWTLVFTVLFGIHVVG